MRPIRNVLLIYPPWYRLFGEEMPGVPLGLSYIAGVLERAGYDVTIYNADSEPSGVGLPSATAKSANYDAYLRMLKDLKRPIWNEIREMIARVKPDMVGISLRTAAFGSALNVSRIAKELDPDMPVVWGGVHPTVMPEESAASPHVDVVVRGEGEDTILDLIRGEKPLEQIPGISYRAGDGNVVHNPDRTLIPDLDSLPYPARHLLVDWKACPPESIGGILSSRGCPFKCVFCASYKVWTRKVRYRTVESVIGEITYLRERFGLHRVTFEDDIFPMSRKWLAAFAESLARERIKIAWKCETRVDLLTEEMAKQMKQSGCDEVFLGLESGSPVTLEKMKKAITLEDMRRAVSILRNAGIRYSAFLMIGFPWETIEDMQKTIDLMYELQPFVVKLSVATPYPGTELHQLCLQEGLLPGNIDWSTCFYQNSKKFWSGRFPEEDAHEVIDEALELAEEYNRSQKRRLLIDHPFYVAGRVIWGKYYYPKRLWTLAGHLVGQGTHPETPAGKEFFDHSGRGHAAHSRSNRVATH